MKYCSRCGSKENLLKYSSHKERKNFVQYYMCRDCNTNRMRSYRKTKNGKSSVLKAVKKYNMLHPKRVIAWYFARKIPSMPCVVCGEIITHRHHPDIDKPMDIVFLCPAHHKEADR